MLITAPVHLYTCTPVHLYTCTPVHLYTCTPVGMGRDEENDGDGGMQSGGEWKKGINGNGKR